MVKCFFVFFLLIFSCSVEQREHKEKKLLPAVGIVPDPDSLTTSKIIFLDSCPKPVTIKVPERAGTIYTPPTSKPADFFVTMPTYNMEQGLALSSIMSSYRDKKGNLWFGTWGAGVSRYDGKTFTNFNVKQGLTASYIWAISEDKNGNMWFGTNDNGVVCYDGKSFTNYTTMQGLTDNRVFCIFPDKKGNIWFGTNSGISYYDGKSFVNYTAKQLPFSNSIWQIAEDKNGQIWFGTAGGVFCYNGNKFTRFTTKLGLENKEVLSILVDKKGWLWLGTDKNGIICYDGKSSINYTTKQGLVNNTVWHITEDKNGQIWFGTAGGASCYNGEYFTNFTTKQGLANNYVRTIAEDKTGNLWMGTFGGGVSRYNGGSVKTYGTGQGLLSDDKIYAIAEDKCGKLWYGTEGKGVFFYDGKTFTNYTTAQGLVSNFIYSILKDTRENFWFGSSGGVSRFNGKTFTNFTTEQGLVNNEIVSIFEDSNRQIWLGTTRGVSCYNGKTFINYTTKQGLINNEVLSILEDSVGNIWFGTNGGISCYNGKSFLNYTTVHGLAANNVNRITKDKNGYLWFGTQMGVSRYDGRSFMNFEPTGNSINDMVMDEDGTLWFGTNIGISGLKFKTSETVAQQEIKGAGSITVTNEELRKYIPLWEDYNTKTGYSIKDINVSSMCITKKNFPDQKENYIEAIWAGCGDNQVICFEPKAVQRNYQPPEVVIQSIKINEKTICWHSLDENELDSIREESEHIAACGRIQSMPEHDSMKIEFGNITFDSISRFYPIPKNLTLPYEHRAVTFDFAAIEPALPNQVKYEYTLEGYDKSWMPVTNKTSATFGNIREGTYTFKVKAQSPFGVWSEPVTYNFTVLPPWWRTWWMCLFYCILTAGTLLFIIKWNGRRLIAKAEELKEKVNDATVEIIKQKEIVEKKNKEISKNEKMYRSIIEEAGDVLFTTNTDGMFTYMNKRINILAGYSVEELLGKHYSVLIAPECLVKVNEFYEHQYTNKKHESVGEFAIHTKTGDEKWVEQVAIMQTEGESIIGFQCIVRDITERKKANLLLVEQKQIIETKNKDILDSIQYAKHIQNILLKEEEHVSPNVPEHFILFMPKDILSGDFYWGVEKQNHFYVAAVDCTGHGVPGALMSMLGMAFINQITSHEKLHSPAEVMDRLRNKIIKELTRSGKTDIANDGMDMSLLRFNLSPKKEGGTTYDLQFAGANHSLYFIQNNEMKEIKGSRQPVGYYPDSQQFKNHELEVHKGDIAYIFSDGYPHQFGGPKGRKFNRKQLLHLLLDTSHLSMKEQKDILKKAFLDWKGNLEQVDDVCVIGIRI